VLIIAAIFLFEFPRLVSESKKILDIQKTPKSVSVTLVAPPKAKPKPKKPKKIVKKPKKKKPKKKIVHKRKPKPKKILKPKPEPKVLPKPVVPVVEDKNVTEVVKKAEIKKEQPPVVPVVEQVAVYEEPVVESISADEQNEIDRYEDYLRETIFTNKKYPTKARRMRHQGSVKIEFVIDDSGKILSYNIIKSSGFSTLDGATKRVFEKIGSFKTPPKKLETPYRLSITLKYRLH
jgi:protein TonB